MFNFIVLLSVKFAFVRLIDSAIYAPMDKETIHLMCGTFIDGFNILWTTLVYAFASTLSSGRDVQIITFTLASLDEFSASQLPLLVNGSGTLNCYIDNKADGKSMFSLSCATAS